MGSVKDQHLQFLCPYVHFLWRELGLLRYEVHIALKLEMQILDEELQFVDLAAHPVNNDWLTKESSSHTSLQHLGPLALQGARQAVARSSRSLTGTSQPFIRRL